jgi:leader peptidase (prepilin peptidase)/N-methyltransferase
VVVLLAVAGLVLGPWLAVVAARLAARDRAARPSAVALVVTSVLAAAALPGAVWVTGSRPATAALVWLAGSALVLAATDLAAHRLPDVVTVPAYAVCAAALVADAALLGTWGALLRSVLACAVAFAGGVLAAAVSPQGLGFGDVKLLGLLGLVLGWAGWDVLMACVFVGLLVGAGVSLVLLAARRVGWRTAIPFGPSLLVGAAVALAAAGPLPLP